MLTAMQWLLQFLTQEKSCNAHIVQICLKDLSTQHSEMDDSRSWMTQGLAEENMFWVYLPFVIAVQRSWPVD